MCWCCAAPASAADRITTRQTLYVPPKKFFDAPEWAGITDWPTNWRPASIRPGGCSASCRIPCMDTQVDRLMHEVAREMGRGETLTRHLRRYFSARPASRQRTPISAAKGPRRLRVHQLRQLHDRLRAQRQEQADRELSLPGGEARGRDPRTATKCTRSSRSRTAGSQCMPDTRAGCSGRRTFGRHNYTAAQVIVSAHAYGLGNLLLSAQAHRHTVELVGRAWQACPHELRAAGHHHPPLWRMEARPRPDSRHASYGGVTSGAGPTRDVASSRSSRLVSVIVALLPTYRQHGAAKHPAEVVAKGRWSNTRRKCSTSSTPATGRKGK